MPGSWDVQMTEWCPLLQRFLCVAQALAFLAGGPKGAHDSSTFLRWLETQREADGPKPKVKNGVRVLSCPLRSPPAL